MSPSKAEPELAARGRSARVIVIGFGSPIRGDDAFGPLVADQFAEQLAADPGDLHVEALSRHILTAEMAVLLEDATLVLFVDAAADGEIGEIDERPVLPRRGVGESMTHSVDAPGLLAWTEGLYGTAPPAILLSTRAVTFNYAHYQLSAPVEATVPKIINRLRQLIQSHVADLQHA